MRGLLLSLCLIGASAMPAAAQSEMAIPEASVQDSSTQEYCINVMSGFPNEDIVPRYQFFKLTTDLAVDATPGFQAALTMFGDGVVNPATPIVEVIETIANPVLRQAAPELIISHTAHLIDFSNRCALYVDGQVNSLRAFDAKLANDDRVIAEDALFLRQVLSDSLFRLDANIDPVHGPAVQAYADTLVFARDNLEFQDYASDVEDLETLFMADLDGRLARSNDVINNEVNRETLGDAVTLSKDMNKASKEQADRQSLLTLLRILGRY